ncbi:MAG TPA: class I lanthipeptide [Thermoanaerobaculia bacterium]
MKKQIAKKLVLNRETLRELTENLLGRIGGGIGPSDLPEDSCYKTCWCDTTK